MAAMTELRAAAAAVLCASDPGEKLVLARRLGEAADSLQIAMGMPAAPGPVPGRPDRPVLVHPARVPRRSPSRHEGLAALLHAIAHIEFNAINLAADCAWRFDGMPREFHLDWVRIMAEEASHFSLLADLLAQMGHRYGDFEAHDGLWRMCEKTAGDIVARLALVPRTLEARGLDATPQIQDKLRQVASPEVRPHAARAVEVLAIILRDEVGHVAAGNQWYRWCCAREGLDPLAHYAVVAERHAAPRLYPPFNEAARRRAGFSDEEIASLGS